MNQSSNQCLWYSRHRKLKLVTLLWLMASWPGHALAEECILDDGFIDNTADGFDTNGGATSDMTASVACGQNAGADAAGAVALGSEAKASDTNAIAIGLKAKATKAGAIAIGAETVANNANTMTVGVPVEVKGDSGSTQILVNERMTGNPVKTLFSIVCTTCTPGFRFSQTMPSNQTWNFRMLQSGAFTVDDPASSVKEAEFRFGGDLKIGGNLIEASSRTIKKNIEKVDPKDVLARLDDLEIHRWSYNHNPDRVRHMGPMAEDFYALFKLGETEMGISGVDTAGVALAAIKALNTNLVAEISEKDRQIDQLKQEKDKQIAALKLELEAVKSQLAKFSELNEVLSRFRELERSKNYSQVSF